MSEITAEQYEAAVGHAPEYDDLERSNCGKAGEICHTQCGWDHERNLPEFIASAYRFKELLDAEELKATWGYPSGTRMFFSKGQVPQGWSEVEFIDSLKPEWRLEGATDEDIALHVLAQKD